MDSPRPRKVGKRRLVLKGLILLAIAGVVVARTWWAELHRTASVTSSAQGAAIADLLVTMRFPEAEAQIEDWVRDDPNSASAFFLQARLSWNRRRGDEAMIALLRAEQLGAPRADIDRLGRTISAATQANPAKQAALRASWMSDPDPWPETAETLVRLDLSEYRLGAASAIVDRWTEVLPRDPRPFLYRARIEVRRGAEPDQVIGYYREAIRRNPETIEAWTGLAEWLWKGRMLGEAAQAYAEWTRLAPADAEAWFGAARVASDQGDTSAALAALDRALTLNPSHPEANRERARIDLALACPEAALERLDRTVLTLPRDIETHYLRGLALLRLGRVQEAHAEQDRTSQLRHDETEIRMLREDLQRKPNDPDVRLRIARWFLDRGEDAEGLRWAELILKDRPSHAATHRTLTTYYEAREQLGRANYHRLQGGSPTEEDRLRGLEPPAPLVKESVPDGPTPPC